MPLKIVRRKDYFKHFFTYFLPVLCIITALFFYLFFINIKQLRETLKINEVHHVEVQKLSINREFKSVIRDLLAQLSNLELSNYMESNNIDSLKQYEEKLLKFSHIATNYDQVRYIDEKGMEIVRVNNRDGIPHLTPHHRLQNKSKRYYFKKSINLKKGEIYISPFDLNVENEVIETPFKPVIRFTTPVFDSNRKRRGFFMINYLGKEIISILRDSKVISYSHISHSSPILLNKEGYFLLSSNWGDQWGFMFAEKRESTFNNYFPKAWHAIKDLKKGQFWEEKGLFTFETINTSDLKKLTFGTEKKNHLISSIKSNEEWKIISFIPAQHIFKIEKPLLSSFLFIYFFSLFSSAITLLLITFFRLKRSEEEGEKVKLATALEQSPASVIITDFRGKILYFNPAFLALCDYDKDKLKNVNHSIFQDEKKKDPFYQEIWQTLERGKSWQGDLYDITMTGRPYWASVSISPIKDNKNKNIYFVIVEQDISPTIKLLEEMKSLNENLLEAKVTAEAATKAKSDFVSNMSHELRTPLSAVIGFTDMLISGIAGELTPKQQDFLGDIKEAGEHLLLLINDILDISKIESGTVELQYSSVNINDLINRSLFIFNEKIAQKNIIFSFDRKDNEVEVPVDKKLIRQVLINLLSNAIKFSPQGGSVTIGVVKRNEKETIEIYVKDTGIGIKEEDMDMLFIPFKQLDPVLTKKYGGTGLGLALCKEIVELHCGEITAQSEWGKGSKFTIILPINK